MSSLDIEKLKALAQAAMPDNSWPFNVNAFRNYLTPANVLALIAEVEGARSTPAPSAGTVSGGDAETSTTPESDLEKRQESLRQANQLVEELAAKSAARMARLGLGDLIGLSPEEIDAIAKGEDASVVFALAIKRSKSTPGKLPPLPKAESLLPGVYAYREVNMDAYGKVCYAKGRGDAVAEYINSGVAIAAAGRRASFTTTSVEVYDEIANSPCQQKLNLWQIETVFKAMAAISKRKGGADGHDGEDALLAAARAVVQRWDSPKWKDEPHTAEYIDSLRAAIEAKESNHG